MSNGDWKQASEWNRGGPALYAFFWIWTLAAVVYSGVAARQLLRRGMLMLTVVLTLLTVSSCGGREQSLIRLVPGESCAIMILRWSAIRADSELKRVINGNQLERVLQELGINGESVETIAVFAAIDNPPASGLLFRGSFDQKEVAEGLKRAGWTESTLGAHKVYVRASEYVAIPVTKILFAGTREGALAVLRAAENPGESIVATEAFKKIRNAASMEDKPVRGFLLIPQGTLDMADAALTATSFTLSLFNLGAIGQLLQAVNVAKGFAFSLDKGTREQYPVELCVLLRDEQSAVFVSGSLNALKTVSELAATDNRDRANLVALRQMKIVRKHEVLAITMEIPGNALLPEANQRGH